MNQFQIWWVVSFVVLLALAWWIGTKTGRGPLGHSHDVRGRYSLTHFQLVLWTIVILSSAIGVLHFDRFQSERLRGVPLKLLGLMGISAGSGVLATSVKATKDASGTAKVARNGTHIKRNDGTQVPSHLSLLRSGWRKREI